MSICCLIKNSQEIQAPSKRLSSYLPFPRNFCLPVIKYIREMCCHNIIYTFHKTKCTWNVNKSVLSANITHAHTQVTTDQSNSYENVILVLFTFVCASSDISGAYDTLIRRDGQSCR